MTEQTHPRVELGALALNALDSDEAAEVHRHLADCADCQADYDRLSRLPALLSLVPDEAWTCPPQPSELGLQRLLRAVRVERQRTRRRLVGGAIAAGIAAAAVAAVGVLVGVVGVGNDNAHQIAGPVRTTGSTWQLTGRNAALGVSGGVTVVPVTWGSKLDVELDGVRPGLKCSLLVIDKLGNTWDGGSWTVSDSGAFYWSGAVAIPDDSIARVEVVTSAGRRLLTLT